MLAKIRSRLTYANVVSSLCLFLVLGGGGAYAAVKLGKGVVKTKNIANNAVTSKKVKNGSLKSSDFAAAQLPQGPPGIPGPTAGANAYIGNYTPLTTNPTPVVDLASLNDDHADHTITTTFPSRIFASVDPAFITDGTAVDSVHCNLMLDPKFGPKSLMGTPRFLSTPAVAGAAANDYEVMMPVVGASQGTPVPAGNYNVSLECAQDLGHATLHFISANMIVWAVKAE